MVSTKGKNMTFGDALESMKRGHKARRSDWVRGMGDAKFLFLDIVIPFYGVAAPYKHALCVYDSTNVFASKLKQNWTPTQEDMLAEDWEVVS